MARRSQRKGRSRSKGGATSPSQANSVEPTSSASRSEAGGSTPPSSLRNKPFALNQVRETAQALLAAGRIEEATEYFLAALDAVLARNREVELLLLKLRRERFGRR